VDGCNKRLKKGSRRAVPGSVGSFFCGNRTCREKLLAAAGWQSFIFIACMKYCMNVKQLPVTAAAVAPPAAAAATTTVDSSTPAG
jgi:hypothetical protein